ncbi:MAG: HEAT repeat domain-containing protein [Sedimentisphaerales bacterium]|nr:HEAT repeat domain-containing protein [Sedimentisphaerales bacterium]
MRKEEKNNESDGGSRLARWKKIGICAVLGVFVLLGVSYLFICLYIGAHVKSACAQAMQEYPGDRLEAVIAYVESESHSLRKRNKAVWALGYLGDKRALPVLKKHFTGGSCDHNKYLCQGELGKAIKKCEGGLNPCAWACR